MAINQAIIRIRRGLKDELQIDKLLPGELAMATDAPCMWFCWSPGEVEQVPTSGNVIEHINEIVNEYIVNNDISVIGKVFMRIYNGWIQYSPDEKTWENVISLADIRGDEGGYYIPVVNNNGTISWQPSHDGMEELQDSLILSKEIIESVLGYVPLKKTDVVDNLLSTSTKLPLSANQGNVLNTSKTDIGLKDFTSSTLSDVAEFITTSSQRGFLGRIKFPTSLSPSGSENWFRCVCLGQNATSTNVGINILAMEGSGTWEGFLDGNASSGYTLNWNKLAADKKMFPNYSGRSAILAGIGSYTIQQDGFVQAYGYNKENGISKPLLQMYINGIVVERSHGADGTANNYTGHCSPLYPVKKGDVIKVDVASWTGQNTIYFYPTC